MNQSTSFVVITAIPAIVVTIKAVAIVQEIVIADLKAVAAITIAATITEVFTLVIS